MAYSVSPDWTVTLRPQLACPLVVRAEAPRSIGAGARKGAAQADTAAATLSPSKIVRSVGRMHPALTYPMRGQDDG